MIGANMEGYEKQWSNDINMEKKIKEMQVIYYMEFPSSWYDILI